MSETLEAPRRYTVPRMEFDRRLGILTIDGHKFSWKFFEQLTASPPGVRIRILSRDDGIITVGYERSALESAAPDLLAAQTMGASKNTPDFLDWIANRLVRAYGENPNLDFVLSLRERAQAGRLAIVKAIGTTP